MADVTKEKIINIKTNGAEKNVKSLKTQIRELKEQMAQLEQGTEEYNALAKKLADTNQKQIEINEAMTYSNKDFGATLSNLTKVSAGVVGAISSINGVMTLMGADSEEAMEAMKNIQAMMAIIQGLGAVDTAYKALKGLANAFRGTGKAADIAGTTRLSNAEKQLAGSVTATSTALGVESGALVKNTTAKAANATATKTLTGTSKTASTATKGLAGGAGILTKALNVLKGAFTSVLGVVGLAVAAIGVAAKIISDHNDKVHEAAENIMKWKGAMMELQGEVDNAQLGTKTLVDGLNDLNKSLGQRKAIADQLNKVVPELNAYWDEEAGMFVYSEKALNAYNYKLEQNTKYQSLLNKQKEAHNKVVEAEIELDRTRIGLTQWDEQMTNKLEDAQKNYDDALKLELHYKKELQKVDYRAANDPNTVKKETKDTKTLGKSVKELIELFKELRKTIFDVGLNFNTFKMIFNGYYSEAEIGLEKIRALISKYDLGKALTEKFQEGLADAFRTPPIEELSLSNLVKEEKLAKIEADLKKYSKIVDDYVTGRKKVRESVYNEAKREVDKLKEEAEALNALVEEVHKVSNYHKTNNEYLKEQNRLELESVEYQERMITYRAEMRANNPFAETNKEIDENTIALKRAEEELESYKKELESITNSGILNKQNIERYREVATLVRETELEIFDLKMNLENAYYEQRKVDIEEILKEEEAAYTAYYDKDEKKVKGKAWEQEKRNLDWGQTDNYNSTVKAIQNTLDMLDAQMKAVEKYYDTQMAKFEKNSVEWINLEIEKNATLEELDRQHMEKSVQLEQEKSKRRLTIAKTYISAYSALSSQIGSILSAEMERYDENSKEYKNMKYAQGVMNTAEGVLAAFMSGIDSGIPAPWNLALATAMSGIALTAGIMQLNNIKNEKLGGSMPNSVNIGSEYDTLSYQTNVDTLSAIQDQRVIVVESDITDTQNRVRVSESAAMF